MTKCIVLDENKPKEEKKVIEFTNWLGKDGFIAGRLESPSYWDNIVLLSLNYRRTNSSLMFAYNTQVDNGCLYLGHWNDGIV